MMTILRKFFPRRNYTAVELPPTDPSDFHLTAEDWNKQSRILRRIALLTEQQLEFGKQLGHQFSTLQDQLSKNIPAAKESSTLSLSLDEILSLFADLDKLRSSLRSQSVSLEMLDGISEKLLARTSLRPIAKLGDIYDPVHCEVVEAIPKADCRPGTICEILRQGYLTDHGERISPALVVVTKEQEQSHVNKI